MARSKVIVAIYDYVVITLGVILFVMAWQCFLLPNNMIDGGLTGASALLSMVTGISVDIWYFGINVLLLILALIILGRGFGLKPIYALNPYLQFRFEAYAFVPIFPILQNEEGKAYYGKALSTFAHLEELSIVGRFSTFVISAYLNHNSSSPRSVSAGISLGWYMFNNRFIEQ